MGIIAETHILIIWSEGLSIKDIVLNDLKKHFVIKQIYKIKWDKDNFLDNLRVFYAHSQKHVSDEEYTAILENKMRHCGSDDFYLVVFEDKQPIYENRMTSSGERNVNTNIFDLKQHFRSISGGGHKIHTSDTVFESNKDLTLLLGKNSKDFNDDYVSFSDEELYVQRNCTGVNGYKDIDELFYVLNNTIDYCVMRNYECLPNEYTLENHGDIDLLVENLNYIKYLTNAKPVFPHLDYRVHYTIKIAGEEVPFDFRYVGDEYYDIKWQLSLLKNKKLFKDTVYIPDDKNYFYSLLYHAYVQKPYVKEDYHERLNPLGKLIKVDYNSSITAKEVKELLDEFLEENQYQYTIAKDSTVYYNKLFVDRISQQESQYGQKISQTQCRYENQLFFSEVYLKEDIITKIASKEIIHNEVKFLKRLEGNKYVPEYICHKEFGTYAMVQMKKIEGKQLSVICKENTFWSKQNIFTCIKDGIAILKTLLEHNISHRDIRPQNLIFGNKDGKPQLSIIDFGWAIDFNDKSPITPFNLGSNFKYGKGQFLDTYSMGKVFNSVFKKFSLTKGYSVNALMNISANDYSDKDKVLKKVNEIYDKNEQFSFTLKDHLILILYKNPLLLKAAKSGDKLLKLIKK